MARSPSAAARARHLLVVSAGVGVATAALVCGALPAEGETGPPSDSGAAACPSPNPPNTLALTAGTPQSAPLGGAFATNLQVAFTNTNNCPVTTAVAGIPVAFSAPSAGASGRFTASGSNTVTIGSDASGVAVAPTLTADDAAGGYTVVAHSVYGLVSFALTNIESSASSTCDGVASATAPLAGASAGRPTELTVGVGATQSTAAAARFPIRLAVTVTDAEHSPVPGVLVTFAAPKRGPSGYFTVRSGGAHARVSHRRSSRASRSRRIEVRSDACGIAIAPAFTANHSDGGYVVVASVEHVKAAFALVNEER